MSMKMMERHNNQ